MGSITRIFSIFHAHLYKRIRFMKVVEFCHPFLSNLGAHDWSIDLIFCGEGKFYRGGRKLSFFLN